MIHDGTTEFFADHPVQYSRKGEVIQTNAFTLGEPCMDHYKHYTRIRQMLMRVFQEMGDKRKDMAQDISGEEVKAIEEGHEQATEELAAALEVLLLTSERVDVAEFMETFRVMACMNSRKPIVTLDDEQRLTDAIWSNMHPDDGYKMAIRWAAFFAMPSDADQKTSSSKQSQSASQPRVV